MAYSLSDARIGAQPLDETSPTQNHPLGTLVRGVDPVYGEGTFIYLKGVASTVVGDAVVYDTRAGTSTRAVAGSRGPAAVAMSANVASQFGWYQVVGSAITKAGAVLANGSVYVTTTAGTVDDAVVVGDKMDGARFKTADGTPSAGFAVVQLAHPSLNANG